MWSTWQFPHLSSENNRSLRVCYGSPVSSICNTQKVLSEKELTELFSVTDVGVYILSIGTTDLEKQVCQKCKQRCVTDLRVAGTGFDRNGMKDYLGRVKDIQM